jgi:hypothetical protein
MANEGYHEPVAELNILDPDKVLAQTSQKIYSFL